MTCDEEVTCIALTATDASYTFRNHKKSLAPGQGLGERSVSEKLFVSFFHADPSAALALAKLLPLYGSWKSCTSVLILTDELEHKRRKDANDDLLHHPSLTDNRYAPLQAALHRLFAIQLMADAESHAADGPVSNASKFVPHETRSSSRDNIFMGYHEDQIIKEIRLLCPAVDVPDRKAFRKLRVMLNVSNNHIAEVFLAQGNAEALDPMNICAGAFAYMRKGLLNEKLKTGGENSAHKT